MISMNNCHILVYECLSVEKYEMDVQEFDEDEEIPEEILQNVEKTIQHGVYVKKSNGIYEKEYDKFQQWMLKHNMVTVNETVLLNYFEKLVCLVVIYKSSINIIVFYSLSHSHGVR